MNISSYEFSEYILTSADIRFIVVVKYHIGGYQVLQKYLKDRKGRMMDDPPRYCRIVTALSKTIEIQERIDTLYPAVENDVIVF